MTVDKNTAATLIADAIEDRRTLAITYNGEARIVEPYAIGVHASTHNWLLRGYQTQGGSESGKGEGWRLFALDKIEAIGIQPQSGFNVRDDYRQDDRAFGEILIQL